MTANELRIGNLVMDGKDIEPVNARMILMLENGQADFDPIPLTEEWLVRLGFESNPYQDRYENKAIHVECNKTKGYTELWIERMPHIKYVHQLQNLVFAISGEELTTTTIQ